MNCVVDEKHVDENEETAVEEDCVDEEPVDYTTAPDAYAEEPAVDSYAPVPAY